ncbi:DUF2358 domain-containing protein, partial [Cephalotus follicularis]
THISLLQRLHSTRCCSGTSHNHTESDQTRIKTPQFLRLAVGGVTELLRFLSSSSKKYRNPLIFISGNKQSDELVSVNGVDDVINMLKSDYDNAYFVTGRELYSRNLKLLVPFFDCPSIALQKIEKGVNSKTNFVLATWKLRTHLKLPWRPLISIDGSTVYGLNDDSKIIRHTESWNVSALEAVAQIFTPNF